MTDELQTHDQRISSEQRLRKQQAALTALAKNKVFYSSNFEASVNAIVETAAHTLEVEWVGVWFYNESRTAIYLFDLYELSSQRHSSAIELLKENYPTYFQALETDEMVVANDARSDPRTREFLTSWLEPKGITSMLDVPIRSSGITVGVLCHEQVETPRHWTIEEQNFASSLAHLISLAIEARDRTVVENSLLESEGKYRNLVETSQDLIWSIDVEGRYTFVNQAVRQIYGYEPQELLGRRLTDFILPEQQAQAQERIASILAGEACFHYESRQLNQAGKPICVMLNAIALRDAEGKVIGATGTASNITERQQAEAALRQKTNALERFSTHLKHLHRLNTTHYKNFDALLADYLTTGCEIFGLPTGIISQITGQSYRVRSAQSNLEFLTAGMTFALNDTYCATVVREKRTVTYAHVGEIESMQSHPVYQELLEAYIGTPIWVEGEIYGTLNFSATEPRPSEFELHEREIIELMAQSIGRFIAADRVEQERQRSNQRSQVFAEMALKIRRSLQLETILATTVAEVQKFLDCDRVIIFQIHSSGSGTVVREAVVRGYPVILGHNIDDPCFREEYVEKYRQGRISAITDISQAGLELCHVELLQQYETKANLVVPILQKEDLWGLLIAHQCSHPRSWTDLETELLQHLANQVGIALAQSQLIEALRESEARFRLVADSAPVLLWMSDINKCRAFVNQTWLNFTGCPLEQELGNGWVQGVHPEDRQRYLETYNLAFDGRQAFTLEYRLRRTDGEYRWLLDTGTPRFTPDGSFAGYIGSCIDISDRREVERLKDEFVSIVSHELRTPLTSIDGALALLASGVLQNQPQRAQRMLNIAISNTERLVRLINDILDIERIESGKVTLNKQVCDAANLVGAAEETMRNVALNAGVALSVSPVSAKLWADSDRIIQVLTNLLSNAIKFSAPGSTVRLTAQLREADSPLPNSQPQILFQVKDQGRGIPDDKLETIFGRFQQVDTSDSRKKGGTGLGLAICRSIVQQHEGQIWAESVLGQESTFFVTLPVLLETASEIDKTAVVSQLEPLVLVCDDDPSVRTVIQTTLEQQDYRVITAASGQEAIQQSLKARPDAILLNLVMPGMDGWQTLAVLKEQPQTNTIPIIIVSGLMPDAKTFHPEVSDWIVKPPNQRQLFQALERALTAEGGHSPLASQARERVPLQEQTLKVLIVEDDLDLAHVLATIFERYGLQTSLAYTGREAVQLSQRLLPDLLVLDLGLPEGDGFAVVDWLRQHNRLQQVPLVIYTARDLNERDRERLKLGQTLFLTKGRIAPDEFERRVISLLNRIVR